MNKVSLPRAISKLGFASRSQALALILRGSVKVNGREEKNPHRWVNLRTDAIQVEKEILQQKKFRYLIFHKPGGVVTTHADERGRVTIFEILGDVAKGLFSVGRLDKDTTGVLLLTNDHEVGDVLTSPDSSIGKTYIATLDRPVREKDLGALQKGVEIQLAGEKYRTKPADVKSRGKSTVEITIQEGKNRQLHRMFEELGYVIVRLHRVSVGGLDLRELREGQHRELSVEEVKTLRLLVKSKRKTRENFNEPSEGSAGRDAVQRHSQPLEGFRPSKHRFNAKNRIPHR